ncbi:putative bifunctional diguanylate cyclase/phosphodiesterase [Kineosporia babensis]|uniref:Bifunctional diguanylate cyclase/phosphodiesterase n=1 Tax=Kineosporia babensis TaxID=499548 RepID=A0A9X1NDX5_9ACTN|nr:bifunctional diguanylate cyclase/phosphodiesterase [Kineosporia babensis]MCD5311283.1 bifunctional diguanylate cyclase/phosphodiesterase [Kineosporia babensis]
MRKSQGAETARPVPLLVPLLGLLGLAALAGLTDLQQWLLLVGTWMAVGATLVGIGWYRPAERIAWGLVAGMLALWGGAGLVDLLVSPAVAEGAALSAVLQLAGQACAIGIVIRLSWIRRRRESLSATGVSSEPPAVEQSRSAFFPGADEEFGRSRDRLHRSLRRYGDLLLLVGVFGVVIAQVITGVRALPAGGSLAAAVVPIVDVVLTGLLARFLLSRERLPRALVIGFVGAFVIVANDVLKVIGTGGRAPVPDVLADITAAVAVGLFVWAPLEPSMRLSFQPETLMRRRSESARLLALVPLAAVPALLYIIDAPGAGQLPPLVYVLVGVLVALVALIRGAFAVLDTELLADRDWYTGLLNRRGMAKALRDLEIDPARPWQLALFDLDDFKQINDTFGHYAGDEVLVTLARRLRGTVSPEAFIVRPGGDEFVLVLPPGHAAVETVRDQVLAEPFIVAGLEMPVRTSIGVTDLTGERDLAEVCTEIDIALYAAKDAGRNTVVHYDPKQREQVLGRQQLLTDLRRTLDGDVTAGHFEVYYQPLVELGTGLITGCEALMRWRHAERGMIRPDDFFSLAETSGLAGELDRWVLLDALSQVAEWEDEGIGSIYVSVNLGRTSMLDPALADVTLEYLRFTGVQPSQLHLEITEHDELPPEAGALTLALLTEAGVRVSLDDFGIGYTSLSYLHRYPVRQLKLDRSITSNLQTAPSSPLLEGIVAMAKSLQVDVVAEGIETEPQRERLADLGIAYGQGYHLCRPQPADCMTNLLRDAGPARLISFARPDEVEVEVTLPA